MVKSRNQAEPKRSRYEIIAFRVKFMLGCYLVLMLLIIILSILVIIGRFDAFEATLLFPILFFAFFSCLYDLLGYKHELHMMEEIFIKHLTRLGRRFSKWKEDRW